MTTPGTEGARRESVFHRLYTGTGAFDIVGKRARWYISLGLLVLVCLGAIGFKGFNLGIDFEGGTKLQLPAVGAQGPIQTDQVQNAFQEALGHPAETVQIVGAGANQSIQIRSSSLTPAQVAAVKQTLFTQVQPLDVQGRPSEQVISDSAVSGTWGGEITQQALIALGVFLVLVTIFLAFYFEKWMAVAALVALLHDVVVTAGIYSLVGFEVTPSTVIGLLTILGFSLYDTVVVFDKVKENTRGLLGLTRRTYGEGANLAVNQTLMRSINTSVIALLPVIGLLVVGAGLLGVGVLQDLALVQMVGMITGVVSSIFLATPLLVDFKMRDPKYREHAAKVRQRRERAAVKAAGEDAPAEPKHAVAAGTAPRGGRPGAKAGRPSGKRRR
ncbi:preprotein translocase subunit SecF [Saccharopolyspora shandongensis]|uniref:Protein-export membrane protein SecF n=1 Tax=Saccharopolyspora shandongensis TaxID=418495 RepID=A0A1H3RYE8_9PSEU|nr:preprotein translocase subunit SecF [Saccharopolyspora shandongensis]